MNYVLLALFIFVCVTWLFQPVWPRMSWWEWGLLAVASFFLAVAVVYPATSH